MTDILITSSVLILVVVALRLIFKGKISARLRYGLWALVLLRLFMPVSLFQSGASVMNAAQRLPAVSSIEAVSGYDRLYYDSGAEAVMGYLPSDIMNDFPSVVAENSSSEEYERLSSALSAKKLFQRIWLFGAAALALVFLASNLVFALRLRKRRRPLSGSAEEAAYPAIKTCPVPVYLTDAVSAPCLFGLFRPCIYVTPDCLDPRQLPHVLAHESAHFRHGDPFWSALRTLCLCLYWFDPLVWLAALLSRRDAELACDESAIAALGDTQRLSYGETLIALSCRKPRAGELLSTATTLSGGKKTLRQRISSIAAGRKTLAGALVCVILIGVFAAGCTFTGAGNSSPADTSPANASPTDTSPYTSDEDLNAPPDNATPLTVSELLQARTALAELVSLPEAGEIQVNDVAYFLTSFYSRAEDLDIDKFLRYFKADKVVSEAEFSALKAQESWNFKNVESLEAMPVPVRRISAQSVGTVLREYAGISLSELSGVGAENVTYLPEYDAYYISTSDFGLEGFSCTRGEKSGDTVWLYADGSGYARRFMLQKSGNKWLIKAHELLDSKGALVTKNFDEFMANADNENANKLNAAFQSAVTDYLKSGWWTSNAMPDYDFETSAFHCIAQVDGGDRSSYYGVCAYRRYAKSSGGYECVGQFATACAIVLYDDLRLESITVPGDGAAHDMDIYTQWPEDARERLYGETGDYYETYTPALFSACDDAARAHYGK